MAAYLDTDQFRAFVGATADTLPDASADVLLSAAEAANKAFLGYDPNASSTVSEIYSTNGRQVLPLRRFPVTSVTSVHERVDAFADATLFTSAYLLTAGVDYLVRGSQLVRVNAVWPARWHRELGRLASNLDECPGCVRVVYSCDRTGVLAAATNAGYLEAAARLSVSRGGLTFGTSESLNSWSISLATRPAATGMTGPSPFVAPDVVGLLMPFRRTRIAGL